MSKKSMVGNVRLGTWTPADLKVLKRLFPGRATAEVAADLGRPTTAVKKKAQRMGLKKSPKYMKSLRRKK